MGTFATGVTVVTTCHDDLFHGFTANSVTSVSLDPMLLLVCVDKGATAHAQLKSASTFGVSMLGAAQQEISNLFAQTSEPELGGLRGIDYHLGPYGAPLLAGSIACVECRVKEALDGGDHTIFIGEVLGGEILSDDAPLLYFRGSYRQLAEG